MVSPGFSADFFNMGRFSVALLIPLVGAQNPALPFRPISRDQLSFAKRKRFPLASVLAFTMSKRSLKNTLKADWPMHPIDAEIDNLPVAIRHEALLAITNSANRVQLIRIFADGLLTAPGDQLANSIFRNYLDHIVGNSFLEYELVSIFLKYVYSRTHRTYKTGAYKILSAVPLVDEIREFAQREWGKTMNFLSPQMMIDWGDILNTAGQFTIEIPLADFLEHQAGKKIDPRSLVTLSIGSFKDLCNNKLHRLRLTGYENIDL